MFKGMPYTDKTPYIADTYRVTSHECFIILYLNKQRLYYAKTKLTHNLMLL